MQCISTSLNLDFSSISQLKSSNCSGSQKTWMHFISWKWIIQFSFCFHMIMFCSISEIREHNIGSKKSPEWLKLEALIKDCWDKIFHMIKIFDQLISYQLSGDSLLNLKLFEALWKSLAEQSRQHQCEIWSTLWQEVTSSDNNILVKILKPVVL